MVPSIDYRFIPVTNAVLKTFKYQTTADLTDLAQ